MKAQESMSHSPPRPHRAIRAVTLGLHAAMLLTVGAGAEVARSQETAPLTGASITQQRDAVMKSERIMATAQKRPGLLAQYLYMRDAYANDTNLGFRVIFNQYLSWYQTWVGDYGGARASFSIAQPVAADDNKSPLEIPGLHAADAAQTIATLSRGQQAVFFNENHSYPLTRTLTVQLLATLRAEGFDTFASETLYETDKGLQKRGYPIADSGFYTEEPVYAEMVREALKLGYRVIAYEAMSAAIGDARENEQARNLVRRAFGSTPKARLVLNAGYAHIQESGSYMRGMAMAQHFRKLSGIDPLTIEQTMLVPHEFASSNHPYYRAVMERLKPERSIVFIDARNVPWSLKHKAYDVSVFFPPEITRRGRPQWLDLGGLRRPYQVNGELCHDSFPCLIEARYEHEDDDAIPADRLVLEWIAKHAGPRDRLRESGDALPSAELWLRPGRYRMIVRDVGNRQLHRRTISVRDDKGTSAASTPAAPRTINPRTTRNDE